VDRRETAWQGPNARGRETNLPASGGNPCAGSLAPNSQRSPSRTRTYNKPVNSRNAAERKDNQDNTYIQSQDDVALGVARFPIDADLARVVSAWPDLPEAIRRAVLALIGSTKG
jgi:hypothetical protein